MKNGFFRKDEFRYDLERDAYICPAGQVLKPIREGRLRDLKKIDYGNRNACRELLFTSTMHQECSLRLASGKRGGTGPHGGATESKTRGAQSAP